MPAAVDGLKECTKCGETKPVSEYYKNKRCSDGLESHCRSCRKIYEKKHYQNNKERLRKNAKEYYEANKERKLEYRRQHYQANKEYTDKRQKKYYETNKEHLRKCAKERYEANKEKISENKKEYYQKLPAAAYKIENTVTGKTYIGQSKSYPSRWARHKFDMRHGKHDNPRVQHDCDKHGLDSFEFSVIQEYPCDTSREILFEHEQQLIDEYLAEGKELYNIRTDV